MPIFTQLSLYSVWASQPANQPTKRSQPANQPASQPVSPLNQIRTPRSLHYTLACYFDLQTRSLPPSLTSLSTFLALSSPFLTGQPPLELSTFLLKLLLGSIPECLLTTMELTAKLNDLTESIHNPTPTEHVPEINPQLTRVHKCEKCSEPLTGDFIRALHHTFHIKCFTCAVSHSSLICPKIHTLWYQTVY